MVRARDDCRKLLKVGYQPADREEARNILREIKTTYQEHVESIMAGVHVVVTLADGTRRRVRDLEQAFQKSVESQQREARHNQQAREIFDFEAWKAAGCPPADEWDTG